MKLNLTTISIVALLIPSVTFAQLGGLKNKVKSAAKTEIAPKENSSTPSNSGTNSAPSNPITEKISSSVKLPSAAIDFKQHPFPPTIQLSKMLEKGFIFHSDQKHPAFFLPTAVFLPTKDVNGNEVKYANNTYMYGVIKMGDKILFKDYIEPIGSVDVPFTGLHCSERHRPDWPTTGFDAGDYTCEIYLDEKLIFTMPFQVIVAKNDDVYAKEKEFRLMDGYWSKYGFVSSTADGNLLWNTYEANLSTRFVERGVSQSKQCKVTQQLFLNGAPVSKVDEASYSVGRGEWALKTTTLIDINTPKTTKNYIKLADLKDGAYTLKMKMNEEQREYNFSVSGGKIVHIPEQDRAKTPDTAKAFEGTNKEFWVKRAK